MSLILFFLAFQRFEVISRDGCGLGRQERVGSYTFVVNDDLFIDCSPQNPAFLRIHIEGEIGLSKTLVDIEPNYLPIFLAGRLEQKCGSTLNLLPDAVSIVRWREGETDIWLKVTQPTRAWIETNGNFSAPSQAQSVRFTFGVSEEESYQQNRNLFPQNASLAANQWPHGRLADTSIQLDLVREARRRNFFLTAFELDADEPFAYTARGVSVEANPNLIETEPLPPWAYGGYQSPLVRMVPCDLIYFPWINRSADYETSFILSNWSTSPQTLAFFSPLIGDVSYIELPPFSSAERNLEALNMDQNPGTGFPVYVMKPIGQVQVEIQVNSQDGERWGVFEGVGVDSIPRVPEIGRHTLALPTLPPSEVPTLVVLARNFVDRTGSQTIDYQWLDAAGRVQGEGSLLLEQGVQILDLNTWLADKRDTINKVIFNCEVSLVAVTYKFNPNEIGIAGVKSYEK